MNFNKNWNDRADKDLFFTILSVKNIGVISGSEWTTIGNHMRGLGYGFTNEGCRQHFQGLRRALSKIDGNGSSTDTNKKADPTLNPITRRPGPGRPKKRKTGAGKDTEGTPNDATPNQTAEANTEAGVREQSQSPDNTRPPAKSGDQTVGQLTPPEPMVPTPMLAEGVDTTGDSEPLPLDPESGDEGIDERSAKRRRLDTQVLVGPDSLDDEAVLALAAHDGSGSTVHYPTDFNYGET